MTILRVKKMRKMKMQKFMNELIAIRKKADDLKIRMALLQAECKRQAAWEKVSGRPWK